ncbi:MAG TPA: glycosyltransferase family 4 protein [Burkholderiaceae bacterium]|nr:glycosyltransferase family 4 protein [Burkholderiaceae bacterium]
MTTPFKVLALPKYAELGSSSRLRIYQYLPHLRAQGVFIKVSPMLDNRYVQQLYKQKFHVFSVALSYLKRSLTLLTARRYDIVWLEKEAAPWLPFWLERLLMLYHPRVIADYDDATFHQYDQHPNPVARFFYKNKIDKIMASARHVVAGNAYIQSRALQANAKNILTVPTVIDLDRYATTDMHEPEIVTIGWIGSPATAKFLHLLKDVMPLISQTRRVRFVAIGANEDQVKSLGIQALPWSEEHEVAEIQNFDIGIMPLPDAPFERGKCGYKLLQYMACGKPVIASAVGANTDIVVPGKNGFLANTPTEWIAALYQLIDDAQLRADLGAQGRRIVEERFALETATHALLQLFRSNHKHANSVPN